MIKMKVLLISENTLKQDSLINNNVDSVYLLPAIQVAQDQGLRQIIGSKLYEKICDDVENNSLDNNYKTLLDDYITPYLEFQVMSDIQIPLNYKFRNLGVNQTTDEHTYTPGLKDTQYIIEYYANKAKFYSNRLFDYLLANRSLYPEFLKKGDCSDIEANRVSYRTNIVLD